MGGDFDAAFHPRPPFPRSGRRIPSEVLPARFRTPGEPSERSPLCCVTARELRWQRSARVFQVWRKSFVTHRTWKRPNRPTRRLWEGGARERLDTRPGRASLRVHTGIRGTHVGSFRGKLVVQRADEPTGFHPAALLKTAAAPSHRCRCFELCGALRLMLAVEQFTAGRSHVGGVS